MTKVFFNATVPCPLNKAAIERVIRLARQREPKIEGRIEINVVGDKAIRRLNRQWRGIDKVTDVLSFAWQEDKFHAILPTFKNSFQEQYLGQLYISIPQIKRQALRFKVSIKEEFTRMLIHGLLHIVGYDHKIDKEAKPMFTLQESLVQHLIS